MVVVDVRLLIENGGLVPTILFWRCINMIKKAKKWVSENKAEAIAMAIGFIVGFVIFAFVL